MSLHSDKQGLAVLALLAEVSVDGRLIAERSAAVSCQGKAAAARSSPEFQAGLYLTRSSDPDLAGKPAPFKDQQRPA